MNAVSAALGERVPLLDLSRMTEEVRDEVTVRWGEILDAGDFIGGTAVSRFENEWAAYCGTRHAVGVGNGTDALHLTLRGLGIGPGDEVIVPANTFVATAEAVVLAGAAPRFVDVDPASLLVTAEAIAEAATVRTRAVVVVHLFGQLPDMTRIAATTERLGIHLIEDAAQAQGASRGTRKAGSFGVAGCFSFYPGKNLGAFGDAGAVVTSDAPLAARLRSLRDHGRAESGHHVHVRLGTNSRMDALQAVVLSAKLHRLDRWNEQRRRLVMRYRELLDQDRAPMVHDLPGGSPVHHLAVVQVEGRDEVRANLADVGVLTGIHYPTPCHLAAPFRSVGRPVLPVAERAAGRILSLPLFPHMSPEDVERVAAAVNKLVSAGQPR